METEYLCNLVIPGAAKSGTSSLHDFLNLHPNICMSTSKEPHHFSRKDRFNSGARPHNALFPKKDNIKVFGESSTTYLPWSPAADLIAQRLKSPRIIMVLREPVARTFSHYRWRYRLGLEKRTFLEAIQQDGRGYDPERPDRFGYMSYLEFSNYSKHCEYWLERFGEENCLIINSSNLKNDNFNTLQECCRFLRVPSFDEKMEFTDSNVTDNQGLRPTKKTTFAASFLPKALKSSKIYKNFRSSFLRSRAPVPPSTMTKAELKFVTDALAEDIAWYQKRFGLNGT